MTVARVIVLIPVHNRVDATMECLQCLDAQTYNNIQRVVVDDGSTDTTYQQISSRYPDVTILRGNGNLWWSGAMHMGIEHIRTYAQAGDFVLSLNNDTAFEPGFIDSLVAMSQDHGRAVVGSMEIDYHQRDRILERGVWIDWTRYRFDVKTGFPENGSDTYNDTINVLPGKGTLIPIEVFQAIGNYDNDRFPHYVGDYDFTVRAYKAGFKLLVSYGSRIYTRTDLTGCSITGRPLSLKEAWETYTSIRSDNNIFDHIRFIRKHAPRKYQARHIAVVILRAIYSLRIVRSLTLPARSVIQGLKERIN